MITHESLGTEFIARRSLVNLIRVGKINFAGNSKLKIYGTIECKTGKRMKKANRVFFKSIHQAIAAGYRPCGNCLRTQYLLWKQQD
jgi:methylphosphotriester-DNA--protein-cysteine methyltransferase